MSGEIWDRGVDVPAMVYRANFEQELFARLRSALSRSAREDLAYLRILVAGDLIRDRNDQPIDANHLPPWIRVPNPVPGPAVLSGDCVRGGTFESWLKIRLQG